MKFATIFTIFMAVIFMTSQSALAVPNDVPDLDSSGHWYKPKPKVIVKKICKKVEEEKCTKVPYQKCETLYRDDCKKVPVDKCFYKKVVVYPHHKPYYHHKW